MITRLLYVTLLTLLVCSGCGLIYKQNIQQGNALEQEDLDELYVGMNKRQVLFVLGTPSIRDPFNQDRWDYSQTFSRRGSDLVLRTVTLHFEDDLLSEIIGADDIFGASADTDDDSDHETADPDEVASFSIEPTEEMDPQEAALQTAEEDALTEPEISTIDERNAEDREYQEDMDVLDQRAPGDVTSPDIDG
jgi:outer membrane protein assembly factor BamE